MSAKSCIILAGSRSGVGPTTCVEWEVNLLLFAITRDTSFFWLSELRSTQ